MKILYINNYGDGTGWAIAGQEYILALDAAGIDVVPRRLRLNGKSAYIPQRILDLEQKSAIGCDVVIQHVLPHMMEYIGHMKNIGLFASETSNFKNTIWPNKLNLMDETWVICNQQVVACRNSGVTNKVKVVPHACNIEKYSKEYKPLQFQGINEFVFYFIGEANRRKGIESLLKAFHLEFDPSEDVSLLLKVNCPGINNNDAAQYMANYCNEIKNGLKLWTSVDKYKKEGIIVEYTSPEDIMRIHNDCDCFVMPSYGEAWCIPAFDAMAMGKTPIVTSQTGMEDYINDKNGWLVKSEKEPVFGMMDTFNDLYTGRESWQKINIEDLRVKMRSAFNARGLKEEKGLQGIDDAHKWSYYSVGMIMKNNLEVLLNV